MRSNTPPPKPDALHAATPNKKKPKQADQRSERTPLTSLEVQELAETRLVDEREHAFDQLAAIVCGMCHGHSAEHPIGLGDESTAKPAVGGKRKKSVAWAEEISDLMSELDAEDEELSPNPGMPVDPTIGNSSSKVIQTKPGTQTPQRRGALAGLLLQAISPQQKQEQSA